MEGGLTVAAVQRLVALVAGATRGAGRGIAVALGERGAIVYGTGRSSRTRPSGSGRPETIEETAELVTAAGGIGIAVRVDHEVPAEVETLVARIASEQGRLDVLVNDVWGGDALTQFGTPFWELNLDHGIAMLRQAVSTHIITSRLAVPLMLRTEGGLIVEITDGDAPGYRGNLYYDLVKSSVIRLAMAMARELRERRVASVAVTPGFLRSEAMLELFGVTAQNWRDGVATDANFIASESPLYVGRAVASLATDPDVMARTGRVLSSWALARDYGFTDADGTQPHWGEHFASAFGRACPTFSDADYRAFSESGFDIVWPDWP